MAKPLYAVVAVDLTPRQKIRLMAQLAGSALTSPVPLDEDPLAHVYHYAVPPELSEQLVPGQLLWVPFGQEKRQGLLLGFEDRAPVEAARPLSAIVQAEPFLQPYGIELARWMSRRYLAPLWDTLLLMLPSGVLQSTERLLGRTTRPVSMPLTRDARRALTWIETQNGASTMKEIAGLLGSEKAARLAVAELIREGLLRETIVARPPGVRPRLERFVTLVGDSKLRQAQLRHVGKQSKQADALDLLVESGGEMALPLLLDALHGTESQVMGLVDKGWAALDPGIFVRRRKPLESSPALSDAQQRALEWLNGQPGDEWFPERALRQAGIAPATIRVLVESGYLQRREVGPDRVRLLVPDYAVPALLDELRGLERYRAALDYLDNSPTEMTSAEIFGATGAEWRHLRALADRGLIRIESREVLRNPLAERTFTPTEPPPFTPEQAAVWSEIERALAGTGTETTRGRVFLLHGVTGAGKTEVYLRAVAEMLARGRQAIVLVPEIALTPQTIARFASRFGELVALQHSQLSKGERYDEWRRIRNGQAQVVIGSRSAIFAPVPNPGLIVIDEEHEWSYKQGHLPGYRFPQYHTRDVAEKLVELTGATVILGSATPSLESYRRAETGRYRLLEMGQRVMAQLHPSPAPLPSSSSWADSNGWLDGQVGSLSPVEIVDMRQELRLGNTSIFSRALQQAIASTLERRQQVILFLNRRGAHSFVMCRDCGWVQRCAGCDVAMTAHRGLPYLICHQCSATVNIPHFCPQCLSPRVKHFGVGTQQVEELALKLFPDARILRWDRDTTRGKNKHEHYLARFAGGHADVLVGTQMIAKGLDLPLVTLVGIISADTALHLPDFRSGERTFQLLTQVAGRAGRSMLGGRVLLQTYTPLHYAIQSASRHNFHEFYRHELAFRREHAYPPVAPLVKLVYSDASARAAEEQARAMAERLRTRLAQLGLPATTVIGPAPSFFTKLRGRYRWQVLVRGPHARQLARETPAGIGWEVDVDPASVL